MSVKKNFKNSAVKPSEPGLLSFFILLNNNRLDDNASCKLLGPSRLSLSSCDKVGVFILSILQCIMYSQSHVRHTNSHKRCTL